MASKLLVTNAGLAALVNAQQTGTLPITLSSVQFGSGKYTPTADQTQLQNSFKTLDTIAGGAVGDNVIHITVSDVSADDYDVFEFGVFTSDNVLFAVYSQDTPIISKASGSQALLAIDIVVADAFFSKSTFITPMCDNGFRVISRLRNDAVLFYPSTKGPTGKRGRPQKYDGTIDFSRLDTSRCTEHEVDKGKLYGLKAWSKALKRMVSLAVWYPDEDRADKWQLYFSTDLTQSALDVLEYYRTRFQLEFCFRDSKQYAGITNCQSTDLRKLAFHFNASLTAINLAKAACKRMGIPYSISSCKSMIHNAYMLERFICVSGIQPDTTLIDKIFKELILFTARAA